MHAPASATSLMHKPSMCTFECTIFIRKNDLAKLVTVFAYDLLCDVTADVSCRLVEAA